MMRRKLNVLSVAAMLMTGAAVAAPALAQETGDPVARCDELAASPYDKSDPSRPGVRFDDIDAPAAIEACGAAAKARPDDARLGFQLGRALDKAERFSEALAAYEGAGEGGYALAWNNAGQLYEYGKGDWLNYDKAAGYYRRGVDAGVALSAAELGWMTENGLGVPKDDVEAARLHRIGADAGIDFAQNNLGVMYDNGRGGLPRDYKEAARLYKLAADQGHGLATSNLGFLYDNGRIGPADKKKAAELYQAAIDIGDADGVVQAKNNLAWMYAVDNRDLDKAEALARDAVARDGVYAGYRDTLAYVLYRQGKNDEALALQQKAVADNPGSADYHMRLGDILEALGRKDEARASWRKALALPWTKDDEYGDFRRDVYEAKLAS